MKFIFTDKSDVEKELITELLHSENIKYKIKQEVAEISCNCDDEECECIEFLPIYQIETYTTVEKFEFIKVLFKKKMAEKLMLEKCFRKKFKNRKVIKK